MRWKKIAIHKWRKQHVQNQTQEEERKNSLKHATMKTNQTKAKNMAKRHYLLGKKRKKRMVIIRVRNNGHRNYIHFFEALPYYEFISSSSAKWLHDAFIFKNCEYALRVWCVHLIGQRTTFPLSGVIGNWWNFMEQSIWGAPHKFTCYHFAFYTPLHTACSNLTFWLFTWLLRTS